MRTVIDWNYMRWFQLAKCKICGKEAVIKIPYARIALCREHFISYYERRVDATIKKYGLMRKGGRYVVAVSGGKDSLALLVALKSLMDSGELMVDLIPVYVDPGLGGYSLESWSIVRKLSESLGLKPLRLDVRDALGVTVPQLSRLSGRPVCSVCGLVRRYFLNLVALKLNADAVVLGHHLDDLFAYALKSVLLLDNVSLSKLGPKTLSEGSAVGRIRPLYLITERENLIYAIVKGIPFVKSYCPYRRRKEGIEDYFKKSSVELDVKFPGLRINFMKGLARRGESLHEPFKKCRYCGMPSRDEVCSLCKLTLKAVGEPKGPDALQYVDSLLRDFNH